MDRRHWLPQNLKTRLRFRFRGTHLIGSHP